MAPSMMAAQGSRTLAPAVTATKPTAKMVTKKEWAEIEALWESGSVTLPDLVAKYGRVKNTFLRYFKANGIVKGSKVAKTKKAIEKKLEVAATTDASIIAMRIKETKEQHYKMSSGLAQLAWNEVVKAKTDGVPVAVAASNLKALDLAMNVLKKAREERFAILGLDRPDAVDPDELPELIIAELTAEQIQTLRDADVSDIASLPTNQNDAQSDPDDEIVELSDEE